MSLTLSTNRKTANVVRPSGTPAMANAFGLPSGVSCPGATSVCASACYAGKIERIYKGSAGVVWRNWDALQEADGVPGMVRLLVDMVADFVSECERKGAPMLFRIHWDGDFFSVDYAQAWREVILAHPEVTFWAYTRTWAALPVLAKDRPSNLSLYISADSENDAVARAMSRTYGVPIAALAMSKADALANKADADTRTYICPATTGALKGDARGSACARCQVCPQGRGSVIFVKH